MTGANNKLIVSVDYSQKSNIAVAGGTILLAKDFSTNRRESEPVVCMVIEENEHLPVGTFLLVHHNRFSPNSPHHLGGNLYSLAYNESIFAKLGEDGLPIGLCDNVFVEQVFDNDSPLIPDHLKKPNPFKYKVINDGFGYSKGQVIFCYEFSNYQIVYIFKGIEHRVIKVKKSDIIGKIAEK